MSEYGRHTEAPGTSSVRRPESTHGRFRASLGTHRRKAIAVVATAALGFGGAAAIDQFALAAPPVATASDFGPAGDGLTRLVVTPAAGGVTDADLAALQAAAGVATVQRVFDGSALVATHGLAPADLAGIVADADVTVSPTGSVAGTVTDPYWSSYGYSLANNGRNAYGQTAVAGADVDAPTGWLAGTGTGMVVAVTDTGMDTSHPDLQGALWTNPNCATDADGDGVTGDCHGWNFYAKNADVVNAGGNEHGTGVAGIVGARAGNGEGLAGVAPGVQIMPLVIGYGEAVDITAAAAAIDYAVKHGATVINASWGGAGTTSALNAAIARAEAAGVLVVAAAGNDSGNRDAAPFYPANSASPAVLSVGSSTAADTISRFSAYGATTVDLFAPGDRILLPAPGGGYSLMSGTSMAAPEVAAAVALYKAHYTTSATMAQLRQQLLDDTQPVAAFRGRSVTGGRLSLTALGNTATEVRYGFTSMVAQPGTVTPQIVATGALPAGNYSVRFGLGEEYDGSVYALSGQSLTLNGASATTDDSGEATFSLGARAASAPLVLSPTTALESARYVLTVQLFQGSVPVGLRFAAPLLVGQPAAAPTPTAAAPTTTKAATPTTSASASSTPRSTSTTAAPAVPTVGPSANPTATGGSTTTASSTATATSTRAGSTSSAPSTTAAAGTTTSASATGTATSSGTRTSSSASSTATTSGVPATTTKATTPSTTGSASPTSTRSTGNAGSPTTSASSSATPGPGGTINYPAVGSFGLTSISPSRVGVAGGTPVTITGTAIPSGVRVRIGDSAEGDVVTSSTTRVVFTAPARAAGTYDVHVFGPNGTESVLPGGLTYLAASGTPSSSASPTSTSPTSSSSATSTAAAPTWRTGPHGERLVRSDLFRSLAPGIWKVNCASACSGIAV
jgi:serine protease